MVQWFDTRRWSSGFKIKSFCFENNFMHENGVCEGVGEDSRNGA